MTEKVTGYLLIVVGIALMAIAAFSVYSVFTGSATPFALFNFKGVTITLDPNLPEVEVFPAEVINATTNTLAHLFLMGFIVSVGAKIAALGTNLVRPINVKIDKKIPSILDPTDKTGK